MKANYKHAVYFLIRYVGLYLVLNTLYAFYIAHYQPETDPLTYTVAQQTASLLTLLGEPVTATLVTNSINVPLARNGATVIEVYEGCNSVNVIIVYFCFLIAFRGTWKATVMFAIVGIILIYGMNLLRVTALYGVALHYPHQLYFFHKFLFTGILYAVVFVLWFSWIKALGIWHIRQTS